MTLQGSAEKLPFLKKWLFAINRKLEDLTAIGFDAILERDYELEAKEPFGWKRFKVTGYIIKLTFQSGDSHAYWFTLDQWRTLFL